VHVSCAASERLTHALTSTRLTWTPTALSTDPPNRSRRFSRSTSLADASGCWCRAVGLRKAASASTCWAVPRDRGRVALDWIKPGGAGRTLNAAEWIRTGFHDRKRLKVHRAGHGHSVSPTHGDQEGTAWNGHFGLAPATNPIPFLVNQFRHAKESLRTLRDEATSTAADGLGRMCSILVIARTYAEARPHALLPCRRRAYARSQ